VKKDSRRDRYCGALNDSSDSLSSIRLYCNGKKGSSDTRVGQEEPDAKSWDRDRGQRSRYLVEVLVRERGIDAELDRTRVTALRPGHGRTLGDGKPSSKRERYPPNGVR